MKLKHIIIDDDSVYLFTDNPREDLKILIDKYEAETSKIHLGYETPELITYKFLGKEIECISLWFDNEDIPLFYKNFKER